MVTKSPEPRAPSQLPAIELVTIGTELLLGLTLDTNGAELARELGSVGVRVVRRTTVPDQAAEISDAVAAALGRTGAVVTTGGLGPTRDDVTKRVVADLFGSPLLFDESVWRDLLDRFARLGRKPSPTNRSQAEVPHGATVLRNRWGTAPGLWLEGPPGLVIMLPGVPHEMQRLLQHEVIPRLAERTSGTVIRSLLVRTTGIPESSLAERLDDVEREIDPLTLAYLPGLEGVDLRVSAWGLPPVQADQRLADAATLIQSRAGEHSYGVGDCDLASLVLERARAHRARLAVAESCTGGLLGARLTEIPGSSDVFAGGVIAYENSVKQNLLGVPEAMLQEHGAVSEPVVQAMVEGVARCMGTAAALSITGIAGPGGGTDLKPVGTVWIASLWQGVAETRRIVFPGARHEIRARAAQAALFLLYRRLRPADSARPVSA